MSEEAAAEVVSEPASGEAAPEAAPVEVAEVAPVTWRDGLDAGLRDNPSLTKFETAGDLGKSYIELQGLIGKKGLIAPDDKSTPEQVNEFYSALGRPETAEGYDAGSYQPPEVLADVWETNGIEVLAAKAHELGMTKQQFDGMQSALGDQQAKNLGEHIQSVAQNREKVDSDLRTEWGNAMDEKVALAKRGFGLAAEHAGLSSEELAGQLLPDGGLIGDNAALTKIFAELGAAGGELGFHGGKASAYSLTPAEAEAEASALMSSEAMHDRSNPEHKAAVARHEALLKMQYPGEG